MVSDTSPPSDALCPVCGAPLAPQSSRCDHCGAEIPALPPSNPAGEIIPNELIPQETRLSPASSASSSTPASQAGGEVIPTWEGQPSPPSPQAIAPTATETIPVRVSPAGDQGQPATAQPDWESPTLPAAGSEADFASETAPSAPELLDASALVAELDKEATTEISVLEEPEVGPRVPRWYNGRTVAGLLLRWGPWALGVIGTVTLIILAVTTPSWGSLAARGGITLLAVGLGAAALVALFHVLQHRWVRRRWSIITACLLLIGILGIALAPSIHLLQGHVFEGQAKYQRAIDEYTAGGEQAPNGQNSARAYLEWGQQDLKNQHYGAAVQHLGAAAEHYSATQAAKQAREPMGKALLLYSQELTQQELYGQAIAQFERLRLHYSDTAAAQQAATEQDEPAAYYTWGQTLQTEQHFQDALAKFQRIGQLFPASFYASLAYTAAAGDLYAWGKALVQQAKYDDAVKVDQQLINQYPNAPDAKQAEQDLSAPQQVSGRLLFNDGTPDANVVIRLSSSWTTGPSGYVQGGTVYEAHTDSKGSFTFTSVALGTYLIDWQAGTTFTTLLHQGTYDPVYTANVQPLRTAVLGDLQIPAQS